MKYNLQKFKGKGSRHQCPACGDSKSFTYYVDEFDNVLNHIVGRCNHESGCGYHYTPKQYFMDNPNKTNEYKSNIRTNIIKPSIKDASFIPFSFVEKSASYNSTFVEFLCSLFDKDTLESPTIEQLMSDYAIGAGKDRSIIYWQIDIKGNVRTGKVMNYDPANGHRIKDSNGINWVHSIMKKKQLVPNDFNLVQCLFGEHLLNIYPDKVVAVVEAEKTALICSGIYPEYVWLATGGRSQLSIDKMNVLAGRTVVMFPDTDTTGETYQYWKDKSENYTFCNVLVSDVLEKYATKEEKERKIDIADWLIESFKKSNADSLDRSSETGTSRLINSNPLVRTLIKTFDLVAV